MLGRIFVLTACICLFEDAALLSSAPSRWLRNQSISIGSTCEAKESVEQRATNASRRDEPDEILFSRDVAPILAQHCLACHNAELPEGGFRVDTYRQLVSPGDSGPTVNRESPEDSELLIRIMTNDQTLRMPLDSAPLSEAQITLVRTWLKQGAEFDGANSGAHLRLLLPHPNYDPPPANYVFPIAITSLAFSNDGSELYVGGYHEVLQWKWKTRKLVRRIENVPERVSSIEEHETAQKIYVAGGQPGERGEVRCFDLASGKLIDVPYVSSDMVWDIAVSPDRTRLAIADADRQLVILQLAESNLDKGKTLHRLAVHSDWVTDVEWDSSGERIASASRDLSAKLFDVESGELLSSYPRHEFELRGVSLQFREGNDDRKRIDEAVSVDSQGFVNRWRVGNGKHLVRKRITANSLFPPIQSTGQLLFVDSMGETWRTDWQLDSVEVQFESLDQETTSIAYHAEDELLAYGLSDGTVVIRSLAKQLPTVRFLALPIETPNSSIEPR